MSVKIIMALLAFTIGVKSYAYNVTFRLQMDGVTGYTTPEVNGTFNGWCGSCNPMNDANGDGIWEAVINIPQGYFEYKFSTDNWSQQEYLPVGASCTATTGVYTNRTLNVGADILLPIVCWGSCSACTNNVVTFQVNMAAVSGYTTPYVSGTFNGWCGTCHPMNDPDGDLVFTASIPLTSGYYEYKYSFDNWLGSETLPVGALCTVTSYGYTNRFVNVSQNQTIPVVCWGSCEAPGVGGPSPSISIALSSGNNPGCEDSELTFTASATNLLSVPTYQWQVDGQNVPSTGSTFTSHGLLNGQTVTCRLIGGAGCGTGATSISNGITVQRQAYVTPALAISSSVTGSICAGNTVTFQAIPQNGGSSPTYQWKVNGVNVGTNSSTYTTNTLSNGQTVSCSMISNALCITPNWTLTWADEFNGTSLDNTKWTPEILPAGTYNAELQYYTNSPSNIAVGGGLLSIIGRNNPGNAMQYTSARLITQNLFSFKYGKITGRMKVPTGQGIWPAFWMLGANINQVPWPGSGEIDIMEHINNESKIYGTAHWNNNGLNSNSGNIVASVSGMHDYTVVWDSLSIRFYMDGIFYHQHNITASNGSQDEFTKPFFLLLNVAIGGNWPGYPDASTVFPVSMDVDYVRVWQRNNPTASSPVLSNLIIASVAQPTIWYQDADSDGYGNILNTMSSCTQPAGYVASGTDCNDGASAVNPGAGEICTTAIDDNCNGQINEGCCTSPPASPTSIGGPAGVCRNSTGNVFSTPAVVGATSYQWTLPTGATGSSTSNSITLSFSSTYATGSLSVRAVGPCGTSAAFSRSVLAYTAVPSTPASISGPSVNVCAGTTQTYTCPAATNATSYLWTAPTNATIVSGQGTQTVSISFAANFGTNGNVSVQAQNCFGLSSARTLTVYRVPGTPGTISGATNNVCPGSVLTYAVTAVAGATGYTWTAPANCTISSGQGTNSISLTIGSAFTTGNLSVVATSSCGQSAARTLAISKSPATPSTISGPVSNLCGGGQFTYSITAVSGATSYNWTVPAGCSIVTNSGTSIVMNIPSTFTTGTLTVQAVNLCGATSTRNASLTRLPATPASISGPASVCPSQTGVVFTTPAVTGVSQLWTVPTGAVITGGQNTTSMTCTWGTVAGNVTVKSVNACGQSSAASRSVTLLTCMEEQEGGPQAERIAELEVYPNPNQGTFIIRSAQGGNYKLLSSTGQVIQSIQLNDSNNYSFEVNGLSTGFYFLQGTTGSDYVMQRVVVMN